VPVHHEDHQHWSLAVVCRPWAAARGAGAVAEAAAQQQPQGSSRGSTCVAFLNSLGIDDAAETRTLHFLRGYLAREWEDCVGPGAAGYIPTNVEAIQVEVPQQPNGFDCGIYVLEFVLQLLRNPQSLRSLGRTPVKLQDVGPSPRDRWRRAAAALRSAAQMVPPPREEDEEGDTARKLVPPSAPLSGDGPATWLDELLGPN